jgi:spore germination protein GerM
MKPRDRVLLFSAIGVSVVLIAAALFWQLDSRRAATPPPATEPAEATAPETPALSRAPAEAQEGGNQREVTLFFQSPSGGDLQGEKRKIFLTETITDQARQTVKELIDGPHSELVPTFPPKSEVREVYISGGGTAYVDLSRSFVDDHPGGSSAEIDTLFSLVDTLTFNFPEIKRVKILVEGEERATLKEHLDLTRAYVADMSIVVQGEAH